MEPQHLVDMLLAAVAAVFSWAWKQLHGRVGQIEKKLDQLPFVYAQVQDIHDIKAFLIRIEDKLDRKKDKHE